MSSYSELYLGHLYIGGDKREINPLVMTIFRESDKRIVRVDPGTAEALEYADGEWQPEEAFERVRYECPRAAARDRLDLMGFTAETAMHALEVAIDAELRQHADFKRRVSIELPTDFVDIREIVLETLTAQVWLQGLAEIYRNGFRPSFSTDNSLKSLSPLLQYMLGQHLDGWYGFPGNDVRHAVSLALEVCDSDEILCYDLTELVFGGYYDGAEDLSAHADYLLTEDFVSSRRIVVLTEGSTDKWILEQSLKLLYPHLSEFFTFMDFEGTRMPGGAGVLSNIVKAFIGAGIINRVIAVFDNDSAAKNALRSLERVELPRNITAIQYPHLEIAETYPTLGPSGIVTMNVNGLAASIELYLGKDCLTTESGELIPVHWRGFDDLVGQYQGEIARKPLIHDRFRAKLRACQHDIELIDGQDWSGLRAIIDRLRSAFHQTDRDDLVEFERSRE